MSTKPGLPKAAWAWIGAAIGVTMLGVGMAFLLRPDSQTATDNLAPKTSTKVNRAPAVPAGDICLTDVTEASGISFRHDDGSSGKKYLLEPLSAGVAAFDYDGDGLIDIYFVNGAPLQPREGNPKVTNALYRNEGNLRFRDVTEEAKVGDTGHGLGVTVGDYDNDGDADLFVNNFGPNVLYRNNGDGTFDDVTDSAVVAGGDHFGAGACFLDADGDGCLDLFVANYVDFRIDNHVTLMNDGFPSYPGPLQYEPVADILYRNNVDGTFTDVSKEAGVAELAGNGMGMVCTDYDNDGDTDIVVVNDELGNFVLQNNGSGIFEEVGIFLGLAYNRDGRQQGNMGVDCADYDNDGWLDFFSTSYSGEYPVLYRNLNGALFEDVTMAKGVGAQSEPHTNWGTAFADFDHDGDRDLFIAHGALDPQIHRWDSNTNYRVRNTLLANASDGKFVDVSDQAGDGLELVESSRGIGIDDLDNDGDGDVVILNSCAGPNILRNDTSNANHWIQIQLRGVRANRDGVGAQVRVTSGGRTQLDEVHSGRGYQSHHGSRLHFGLGDCDRVERIEVRWHRGSTDVIENIKANQLIMVVEGNLPGDAEVSSSG